METEINRQARRIIRELEDDLLRPSEPSPDGGNNYFMRLSPHWQKMWDEVTIGGTCLVDDPIVGIDCHTGEEIRESDAYTTPQELDEIEHRAEWSMS